MKRLAVVLAAVLAFGITSASARIALVYGYDAYDAACAKRIAADPTGWDCSDVVPEPVLWPRAAT